MNPISVGLIGCGLWGPNLARNFAGNPRTALKWICDRDPKRLGSLAERLRGVRATTDPAAVFSDAGVDAVVVVTPAKAHYALVRAALEAGKHVLVEKPLTEGAETSRELTALALRLKRVLMTGYVFLFNGAVRLIGDLLRAGDLGAVQYLDAVRTNLGPVRGDVSAAWDLAAHDISILLYWMGAVPVSASANGGRYTGNPLEDVVSACLRFPGGQIGIVRVSWLDPCKVRRITVVGTNKMAVFDDMSPSEPVRVYDKGIVSAGYTDSYGSHRMAVRSGDIVIPFVKAVEPLSAEIEAFLDAVASGAENPGMGELPVQVASVLAAIDESMRRGGAPAEVRP